MGERDEMGRSSRIGTAIALFVAATVMLAIVGCSQPKKVELQPKVSQPAIKDAGTLRAGVDLAYPPFGGTDNGQQAGLDIDVAAALAQRLGLKLVVVPVKASDAATALAGGSADVVLSVPFAGEALSNVSLAGSYISDAPGFFISTSDTAPVEPTMTLKTLPPPPEQIGAQQASPAYWALERNLGPESVKSYPALRDAISALDGGEVPVVAGDALVGAYIARDFPKTHFAGQLQPATLLGVAVSPDNSTLRDVVRSALDGLAADGVLDAIRAKWVGDLPKLKVAASTSASDTTSPAKP